MIVFRAVLLPLAGLLVGLGCLIGGRAGQSCSSPAALFGVVAILVIAEA